MQPQAHAWVLPLQPMLIPLAKIAPKAATLGQRIAAAREHKTLSPSDLARAVGCTPQNIYKLEADTIKSPSADIILSIARVLDLDPYELFEGHGHRMAEPSPAYAATVTRVPLISWTTAGGWADIADPYPAGEGERMVEAPNNAGPRSFALKVRGDSMEPKIPDGSVVVVDPDRGYQHGSIVLAKRTLDQQATLKQLWYDGATPMLRPVNARYATLDMPEDTRIIGVAIDWRVNIDEEA